MKAEPRRSLGFWRCWSLVVGGTIGSAVFMMPAVMAPYGTIGLASLLFATLGAVCVALTLSSLARRVTVSGGMYAYTRSAFGDFAGFLVAWNYWIGCWVSCAALAIGFIAYLGSIIPAIGTSTPLRASLGLLLIWILVGINIAGVRESGIVSMVTTLLKLAPLALVGLIGPWLIDWGALPTVNFEGGNALVVFASIFALSFWNFVGIECATAPAEDTVDPAKTIPRATVFGTITVGAVYLLVGFVALCALPPAVLSTSDSPLADVGTLLFGSMGGGLMIAGAVISIAGALNSGILVGGQVAMAAGRDQLFPASLGRLSRRHTPAISYVVMGVLASVLLLLSLSRGLVAAYEFVILIATLTTVIPYAFSAIASLILQLRDPDVSVAKSSFGAILAMIAFGVCFWVVAASGMETVYWVFLLTMAGLPVYVLIGRKALRDQAVVPAPVV